MWKKFFPPSNVLNIPTLIKFSILRIISEFLPQSSRLMLSWFGPGRLPPGRSLCDELDHFLALSFAVSTFGGSVQKYEIWRFLSISDTTISRVLRIQNSAVLSALKQQNNFHSTIFWAPWFHEIFLIFFELYFVLCFWRKSVSFA